MANDGLRYRRGQDMLKAVEVAAVVVVKEAISIWGALGMANVQSLLSAGIQKQRSTAEANYGPITINITGPDDSNEFDSGGQAKRDDPLQWLEPIDAKCYHRFDILTDAYGSLNLQQDAEKEVLKYFQDHGNAAKISECVRSLETATGKLSTLLQVLHTDGSRWNAKPGLSRSARQLKCPIICPKLTSHSRQSGATLVVSHAT